MDVTLAYIYGPGKRDDKQKPGEAIILSYISIENTIPCSDLITFVSPLADSVYHVWVCISIQCSAPLSHAKPHPGLAPVLQTRPPAVCIEEAPVYALDAA